MIAVVIASPGEKMCATDRLAAVSAIDGSAATVPCRIRAIVRLMASSAPDGCLRASQCTDSGTMK
jgi:hypothetical protein